MSLTKNDFGADIDKITRIAIVPKMLEVICSSTGMGFAAIARVTKDRWVACGVRDEIMFGLQPGGELEISTTICNEIRDHQKPVVIDNVSLDAQYSDHHTPKMYGLQSYISVPIVLKNGEFFGTLCAIDPRPATINNTKTIEMFNMFAELISFHLQNIDTVERTQIELIELNEQLNHSLDENRQYQYISSHNLQEPLRKIRVFSSMLVRETEDKDVKIKNLALRLDSSAQLFSMMIKDLSDYSGLDHQSDFEIVDLNKIVDDLSVRFAEQLDAVQGIITREMLPEIEAIPLQMEQLFYQVMNNSLQFARKDVPLHLKLSSHPASSLSGSEVTINEGVSYIEIRIEDNGVGIDKDQQEKIFGLFSKLSNNNSYPGVGMGLAYCKKIVRNHNGYIQLKSNKDTGTIFSIILPLTR